MAKATVKLMKHGAGKMAVHKVGDAALTSFAIMDNQDDTYTVSGVDAVGNPVDISAVASLTPAPSSDNLAVLTVDAPAGMTFAVHALGPLGVANVLATATWTDGSLGPFAFTLPTTVTAGPAGGVVITPGVPTSH
jgi:hypothetical protein